MVDWNKPIEAVEKATGRVVPMTFEKAEGYWGEKDGDKFMTVDAPDGGNSNELWQADGRNYCHENAWFIRNVEKPRFMRDHRDNKGLHSLYVETATNILGTVERALEELDGFSNLNAGDFSVALRRVRAKLVNEDAAFFEAAAIRYAGKDWLDEAGKE